MKECFCFLFGLIIGIGAMIWLKRFIMSQREGRLSYFRTLHDNFPIEFHECCPDMNVIEMLRTPIDAPRQEESEEV